MTAHLVVVTWLGLSVLEIACRVAARAIARDATPPERCLLVGDAAVADRLQAKLLASPNVKATFVGWIPFDAPPGATTAPVLGTPDELGRVVSEHDVHRVIVAGDATAPSGCSTSSRARRRWACGSACCRGCSRWSDRRGRSTIWTA